MRDAARADSKRLAELAEERNALADAHRRYLANVQSAHLAAESLRGIQAFAGTERFEKWVNEPGADPVLWLETDISAGEDDLRRRTALWEHIRNMLHFTPQPRISEVLSVLREVGIKASRPAVESAIKAHPEIFSVRRVGHERVILLREAHDALKPHLKVGSTQQPDFHSSDQSQLLHALRERDRLEFLSQDIHRYSIPSSIVDYIHAQELAFDAKTTRSAIPKLTTRGRSIQPPSPALRARSDESDRSCTKPRTPRRRP
jgi:hypothetical protein